jgi:hypothetical protein
VNIEPSREQRTIWAFWLACGVAAVAGVVPILLAGTSGRMSGVIIPLWVAAAGYAGCALVQRPGRAMATGLYFIAGLATVYGMLSMLAVPLRLAVIGTCPPAPALCETGLERPLTGAENTGVGFAAGFGIVALLLGFFGLVTLYRRLNVGRLAKPRVRGILPFTASTPPETPPQPPVRRIPPVTQSRAPEPESAVAVPEPTASPVAEIQQSELPPPEPQFELPAPAPELELAAPAPEPELPAHVDASEPVEEVPRAPAVTKPRTRRAPKTPQDTTTPDARGT